MHDIRLNKWFIFVKLNSVRYYYYERIIKLRTSTYRIVLAYGLKETGPDAKESSTTSEKLNEGF